MDGHQLGAFLDSNKVFEPGPEQKGCVFMARPWNLKERLCVQTPKEGAMVGNGFLAQAWLIHLWAPKHKKGANVPTWNASLDPGPSIGVQ